MIPSILRNFTMFVDGRGLAGNVVECNLPKLTIKMDEHLAGGMDAPAEIDMGMEKLESDYSLAQFNPEVLKLFGLSDANGAAVTMRGVEQNESGGVVPIICEMRGVHKEMDPGTWKKGDKASMKMGVALRFYRLTVGGEVVHEIDIENMTRIIGGSHENA